MTLSDILVAFATLVGPIAAVQAQKWIERSREGRSNRQIVFRILMATRAERASSKDHVQALNLIDIYFYKEKSVIEAWRIYYDFLHTRLPEKWGDNDALPHNQKGQELLADLLLAISKTLGYEFSKVHLMRGAYFPQGQADESTARTLIMNGLAKVFNHGATVPVEIKAGEQVLEKQFELHDAMMKLVSGQTSLSVRRAND